MLIWAAVFCTHAFLWHARLDSRQERSERRLAIAQGRPARHHQRADHGYALGRRAGPAASPPRRRIKAVTAVAICGCAVLGRLRARHPARPWRLPFPCRSSSARCGALRRFPTARRPGPQAFLLFCYAAVMPFISVRMARNFVKRLMSESRIREQKDIISLLLKEFEENSSDWLWEFDTQRPHRSRFGTLRVGRQHVGRPISSVSTSATSCARRERATSRSCWRSSRTSGSARRSRKSWCMITHGRPGMLVAPDRQAGL